MIDDDDFWLEACEISEGHHANLVRSASFRVVPLLGLVSLFPRQATKWLCIDHVRVAVRDRPSTEGKALGLLRKGAVIETAQIKLVDGVYWAQLADSESVHFPR